MSPTSKCTPTLYGEDTIELILGQLAEGKGLAAICRGEDMPNARTVQRWANGNDNLAERIRDAREVGYLQRAERAVEAAKTCKDPIAGRLAFDAERWLLGKLSIALRDKPIQLGVQVNVADRDDAFAAVSGVLDRAAAAIASSSNSTSTVAIECETGPADAGG